MVEKNYAFMLEEKNLGKKTPKCGRLKVKL
jgi:hypothetical protein